MNVGNVSYTNTKDQSFGAKVLTLDAMEVVLGRRFNEGNNGRNEVCKKMLGKSKISATELPSDIYMCKQALIKKYPTFNNIIENYNSFIEKCKKKPDNMNGWLRSQIEKYFNGSLNLEAPEIKMAGKSNHMAEPSELDKAVIRFKVAKEKAQ